jgi:hypothetical protein
MVAKSKSPVVTGNQPPPLSAPFMTISTIVAFGLYGYCAYVHGGWKYGTAVAVITWGIYLTAYFTTDYSRWLGRAFVVGIVTAGFNVLSDMLCVRNGGGLIYPREGPFLVDSPLYMSFSAAIAVIQITATSEAVMKKLSGGFLGYIMLGVVTALYQGGFEFLAKWGNLWIYVDVPGLFGGVVPFYIIFCEFFYGITMLWCVRQAQKAPAWMVPIYGVINGAILCALIYIPEILFGPASPAYNWTKHQSSAGWPYPTK